MSLSSTLLLQNQHENTDMSTLTESYISSLCCTNQQHSIAGSRIVGVQLECSGTYIKNVLGHNTLLKQNKQLHVCEQNAFSLTYNKKTRKTQNPL